MSFPSASNKNQDYFCLPYLQKQGSAQTANEQSIAVVQYPFRQLGVQSGKSNMLIKSFEVHG